MGRPYPVAASASTELALVGPARSATVVAATTHATYLEIDDGERTMVCLASADAVLVPCALVLETKAPLPTLPAGMIGRVGGGTLTVGASAFRVTRWWRPPRPRGLGTAPPARLAGAVRWLTGRVADPLDAVGRAAVADLVQAFAVGDTPDPPVARLLGRGAGLTPIGDDVLAGALVTLHALGAPAATTLGAAVLAAAPDNTNTVSVALLRHAARGECVPQLADLLDAVGAPPLPGEDSGGLARAAGALLAVGHCSGSGLLHGVLVALAIAHSRLARRVLPAIPAPSTAAA